MLGLERHAIPPNIEAGIRQAFFAHQSHTKDCAPLQGPDLQSPFLVSCSKQALSRSLPAEKKRGRLWIAKIKNRRENDWELEQDAKTLLGVCWARISNHTPSCGGALGRS